MEKAAVAVAICEVGADRRPLRDRPRAAAEDAEGSTVQRMWLMYPPNEGAVPVGPFIGGEPVTGVIPGLPAISAHKLSSILYLGIDQVGI